MRLAIVGFGAVGHRVPTHLHDRITSLRIYNPTGKPDPSFGAEDQPFPVSWHRGPSSVESGRLLPSARRVATAPALWEPEISPGEVDVAVVSLPAGGHANVARRFVQAGAHVISTSDSLEDIRQLRLLHNTAQDQERTVLMGAGFAPGLSCVLAASAAQAFDHPTEIHVAKHGTGGPACAHQHHRSLKRAGLDYRADGWLRRPGGSGRELVWFPEPVEGADCYRAELPDADLLVPAFPTIERVTARMAATRRDRLTSRLPMLTPPHAEGGVGAIRVEVRGLVGGEHHVQVLGVAARPAAAASVVAAAASETLMDFGGTPGCRGLAEGVPRQPFLRNVLSHGVRIEIFEGVSAFDSF